MKIMHLYAKTLVTSKNIKCGSNEFRNIVQEKLDLNDSLSCTCQRNLADLKTGTWKSP